MPSDDKVDSAILCVQGGHIVKGWPYGRDSHPGSKRERTTVVPVHVRSNHGQLDRRESFFFPVVDPCLTIIPDVVRIIGVSVYLMKSTARNLRILNSNPDF